MEIGTARPLNASLPARPYERAAAAQALSSRNMAADARAEKQLVSLLSIPLESYDVVTVLGLSRYPSLMGLLQLSTRKEMAVKIVQCILKNDTKARPTPTLRPGARHSQPRALCCRNSGGGAAGLEAAQ